MITDNEFQRAFDLAFCLHPQHDVAECIVVEAYESLKKVLDEERKKETMQQRRHAAGFYQVPIPDEAALQLAVYRVSDRWEQSQAGLTPAQFLPYRPTAADWLARYIKLLIWKTMEWRAMDVAVGLGCFLYTYTRDQIQDLGVNLASPWHSRSMERSEKWLRDELQQRFPSVVANNPLLITPPEPHERALVNQALLAFTPWTPEFAPHLEEPSSTNLSKTYFDQSGRCSAADEGQTKDASEALWKKAQEERLQIHALIDPSCAGLARLIRDYNRYANEGTSDGGITAMSFQEPDDKLGVPFRVDKPQQSAGGSPHSGTGFSPPRLSQRALARLRYTLERNRRRQRAFRTGLLSVYVDGKERAQLSPQGGFRLGFTVPARAPYVEVFGHDTDGPLLLAVFCVPTLPPGTAGEERRWVMRLANGQTLVLAVQAIVGDMADVTAYSFELAYEAPEPQTLLQPAPRRALRTRVGDFLSAFWSPPLAGELGLNTATSTTAQEADFDLDEGSIHVICRWWAASHEQPATLLLVWDAHSTFSGNLWACFSRRDDPQHAVLAEKPLGTEVKGEAGWSADELGFDPSSEPWALTLMLMESPA